MTKQPQQEDIENFAKILLDFKYSDNVEYSERSLELEVQKQGFEVTQVEEIKQRAEMYLQSQKINEKMIISQEEAEFETQGSGSEATPSMEDDSSTTENQENHPTMKESPEEGFYTQPLDHLASQMKPELAVSEGETSELRESDPSETGPTDLDADIEEDKDTESYVSACEVPSELSRTESDQHTKLKASFDLTHEQLEALVQDEFASETRNLTSEEDIVIEQTAEEADGELRLGQVESQEGESEGTIILETQHMDSYDSSSPLEESRRIPRFNPQASPAPRVTGPSTAQSVPDPIGRKRKRQVPTKLRQNVEKEQEQRSDKDISEADIESQEDENDMETGPVSLKEGYRYQFKKGVSVSELRQDKVSGKIVWKLQLVDDAKEQRKTSYEWVTNDFLRVYFPDFLLDFYEKRMTER